jgi:hypothetical protein
MAWSRPSATCAAARLTRRNAIPGTAAFPRGIYLEANPEGEPRRWYTGAPVPGEQGVKTTVTFELDHVFLCTAAPETDEATLAEFGLRFTRRRVHTGQGTANTCAVFENAFLELLYAHDMNVLRSDLVSPLGLNERIHWRTTGACPIGICFRVTAENAAPALWPFATWGYKAHFLPPGEVIPVATPRHDFNEPLVFLSHQPTRPGQETGSGETRHGHSLRKLTGVKVIHPSGSSARSPSMRWFLNSGLFALEEGAEHLLELEFNNGRDARRHTFPADLPLRLTW